MSAYSDTDCPTCGGPMVSRKNKTTGQRFFGCAKYPDCNGTRNIDGEARHPPADRDELDAFPSERAMGNDRQRWRHQG